MASTHCCTSGRVRSKGKDGVRRSRGGEGTVRSEESSTQKMLILIELSFYWCRTSEREVVPPYDRGFVNEVKDDNSLVRTTGRM